MINYIVDGNLRQLDTVCSGCHIIDNCYRLIRSIETGNNEQPLETWVTDYFVCFDCYKKYITQFNNN